MKMATQVITGFCIVPTIDDLVVIVVLVLLFLQPCYSEPVSKALLKD